MEKEVKFISLNEIQFSPEKLFIAKIDIETDLEEEKKLTLVDFISDLQMNKVYVYKKQMISFGYKEGKTSNYVFYVTLQTTVQNDETKQLEEEALSKFKEKLKDIKYDLSNLTLKNSIEIIERGIDIIEFGEYFIINNNFYI